MEDIKLSQEILGTEAPPPPETLEDQRLTAEVLAARLRSYGKDNFPELNMSPVTHLDVIKEGSALHSLNLPKQYSEQFISLESARFFLLSDSPLLTRLEEAMPSLRRNKGVFSENYPELKKFFAKWSIEKTPKEADFYAISVLNLFERNTNRENFLKYLYPAVLFIYDKKHYSVQKAVEYLETADKHCSTSSVSEDLKLEFSYLVSLYKAFAVLSLGDRDQALLYFNEAMSSKNSGITAQFYISLLSLSNTEEKQTSFINGIINHDIKRLMFAIEVNDINLFSFFLKTAVSYNIFREPEFSPLLPEIRVLFEATVETGKAGYQVLFNWLHNFTSFPYKEFCTDKMLNEIRFLDQFMERYQVSKNLFLSLIQESLTLKFTVIVQEIKQRIKNDIISKKFIELELYDHQMRDEMNRIRKMNDELESNKTLMKKKMQEVIEETEKKFNDALSALENKIASIDTSAEYDPSVTFNNIMVYNIILAIVLFIIGGFIGSFSDHSNSSIGDHFGSLIVSGIKWGGFVFLGGLLIAVVSSASKVVERTNEKHRLMKKNTTYKNQKDRAVERVSKEYDKKIASVEEVTKVRVSDLNKRIDDLRAEKEERERELKKEAETETTTMMTNVDKAINEGIVPIG
ncbi:MAG: hypothetical protein LWX56_13955 [Ignavibacteria bacterium]|nr:hypothetical protein [Ignavibacteria bacterium]